MLPSMANRLARAGLGGCEYFASVPGTLGGAIRMNAGRGRQYGRSVRGPRRRRPRLRPAVRSREDVRGERVRLLVSPVRVRGPSRLDRAVGGDVLYGTAGRRGAGSARRASSLRGRRAGSPACERRNHCLRLRPRGDGGVARRSPGRSTVVDEDPGVDREPRLCVSRGHPRTARPAANGGGRVGCLAVTTEGETGDKSFGGNRIVRGGGSFTWCGLRPADDCSNNRRGRTRRPPYLRSPLLRRSRHPSDAGRKREDAKSAASFPPPRCPPTVSPATT